MPRSNGCTPKTASTQLGAARALEPGQADDLPGADREVDPVDVRVAGAGQREADLADLGAGDLVGEVRRQRPADHLPHQRGLGQPARRTGADLAAVLEDGDRLAEVEDLLEPVGDVEDRHAAGLEPLDDRVEELDLVVGQRRGRLVHLDDPGVEADGLGDLDDLLLGHGELAHERAGLEVADAEAVEQLGGVAVHASGVDEAEPPRLAAQVDVLGDGALGQQVELLEHRGDPGPLRLDRVAERDLTSLELDDTAVGCVDAGQQLHQRRLARAVLAHQAVHLAGHERDVDVGEHGVAQEALGHPTGR